MKKTILAIAASLLLSAPFAGGAAASPITDAFLANIQPNLAFLDASGRLALDRAKDTAVRAYARGEMAEAAVVADALGRRTTAVAQGDAVTVVTGRSVGIDPGPGGLGQAANGRAPLDRADLDGLAALSGRKFLDAFWLKQLDALSQLRADYTSYAERGDDPALVAMARRELRTVEARLAALTKI